MLSHSLNPSFLVDGIDRPGLLLWDVAIADRLEHDAGIPALYQCVVVAVARA